MNTARLVAITRPLVEECQHAEEFVAYAARTITQKRLIAAFSKGYRVTDDGRLLGTRGECQVKNHGSQRYPSFGVKIDGKSQSLPVHQLAALCFFGPVAAFSEGVVVRHLDGNTENVRRDNIALGTHSDNELDKLAEVRSRSARTARASQGSRPVNARLTDEQVRQVRSFFASIKGKKAPNGSLVALGRQLGVGRQALHAIKSGRNYQNVTRDGCDPK